MSQMVLHNGTYYRPEDLTKIQAAEENAAKRAREFKPLSDRVAELEDRVEKLTELTETLIESFGERIGAVEDAVAGGADVGTDGTDVGTDGGASKVDDAAPVEVVEAEPAKAKRATKTTAKKEG